jgi:hypothetical protein
MQVIDLLAAVRVAVDDQAIAALGDALLPRQIARDDDHVSDERFVRVVDLIGGRNGLTRESRKTTVAGNSPAMIFSKSVGISYASAVE